MTQEQARLLFEASFRRHSVRTFAQEPMALQLDPIPGDGWRIARVSPLKDNGSPRRLGTYGVISGKPGFLCIVTDGTDAAAMACAQVAETRVLELTAQGWGTCWIGGTLKRNEFRQTVGQAPLAVIAVGEAANRQSLIARAMHSLAGASRRLPNDRLFFTGDLGTPLREGALLDRLQSLRWAPSAMNRQPWRVLVQEEELWLYGHPGDYFNLDMGIALAHLAVGFPQARELEELPPPQNGLIPVKRLSGLTVTP